MNADVTFRLQVDTCVTFPARIRPASGSLRDTGVHFRQSTFGQSTHGQSHAAGSRR